jgi:ribosomal protein L11 methyltransferase
LADPISDLLTRHAPGGVVIESTPSNVQRINQVTLHAYLHDDLELDQRRRAIEEGLWHLSQIQEIPQAQYKVINEEDWENAWKDHYHPINVGKGLVIQPAWLPLEETSRIPLLMDPGMAFGTGTHPTTQLCLEALEEHLQPGTPVIDLGCGSGILSIAAARLGASGVLALDIDPIAVQNTKENSIRNHTHEVISAYQGSLEFLLAESPSDRVPAPLVIANIIANTLEEMLHSGLSEIITSDGTLILSGILDYQAEGIQSACEGQGLVLADTLAMDDWRALVLKQMPPST